MSWVILINNAVFGSVFTLIAKKLVSQGEKVIIVTDSKYTVEKFKLDQLNVSLHVFSTWCDDNQISEQLINKNDDFWNIHADFDRDNYYHSVRNKQNNYWGHISINLDNFFHQIFQSEKVDFIFYENISNGLAYSAYKIGKLYNIKYLGLTASRLPGFSLFSSLDLEIANNIENLLNQKSKLSPDDEMYLSNYIKNIENIMPDYMKYNGLNTTNFIHKVFKKRQLNNMFLTLKNMFKYEKNSFQIGNPMVKSFSFNYREIKRYFVSKRIKKLFSTSYQDKNFYLYPLHYHPESSTSILAKYYDEFNLIKNISFSLPHNEYLVVKDHLSASGYETYSFYKKISELPNVILVAPSENARSLINLSKGVFTLTSTVGYEAIILDKPVVAFGEVFYMKHPLVFAAKGYADISNGFDFLKNASSHKEYTKCFLSAYKKSCFPFVVNYSNLNEKEKDSMAENIITNLFKYNQIKLNDESYN